MLNSVFEKIIILFLSVIMIGGCSSPTVVKENKITVTILPLKYLAEKIVGDDFEISTLVPPGSSPETYEPTPQQMIDLSRSVLLFSTGLIDFEIQLEGKLRDSGTETVRLDKGIETLNGDCAHHHGTDPHIWTSPKLLKKMASTMFDAIHRQYPDSVKYSDNLALLLCSLDSLDATISDMIDSSGVRSFVIYHPALTYYANDYGLVQIPLEYDGKEPSASEIKRIITLMKESDIHNILYQSQFSEKVVEVISKETNSEVIDIDPLSEDVESNLIRITEIITKR